MVRVYRASTDGVTGPQLGASIAMMQNAEHPFVEHMLDFYARTAATYDSWDSGAHERAAARCADLCECKPGTRALDLGCGTGLVTRRLAAAIPEGHVVGVDISAEMLRQAQQHSAAATFLHMDARDLYLQNDSFDLLTMCQVLAYQVHPQRVLAECARVLRTGGRLLVCSQQRSLSTAAEQLFFRRLDAFAATGFRIPRPPDHNALLGEAWAITRLLESSGFRVLRTTNLVAGNHTSDASAWIDLMRDAGPYPHALISVMGESMRSQLERALQLTMSAVEDGAFRYHRAFTFALAVKR